MTWRYNQFIPRLSPTCQDLFGNPLTENMINRIHVQLIINSVNVISKIIIIIQPCLLEIRFIYY